MNKLELGACDAVYQHFLDQEFNRDWSPLDDHLYSLSQLDDEQICKEVRMQLMKHEEKRPECVMDHLHKTGTCMVTTTWAAAKAIARDIGPECYISDGERYILEHYLALSHMAK